MHITLSPIRTDATLTLSRAGAVLVVDGLAFDLGPLPEGARLPQAAVGCPWLAGDITRAGGRLHLSLLLPHGQDAGPDVLFPAPLDDPPDGPVALPGQAEGQQGTPTPGTIDWGAVVTAEASAAAALTDWRAACEISKLQLVLGLVQAGLISPASAIAAAGGAIPAEFAPLVAAMPEPAQTEARIRWAGAATIPRLSPLILAVQAATGLPDAALDALFGHG